MNVSTHLIPLPNECFFSTLIPSDRPEIFGEFFLLRFFHGYFCSHNRTNINPTFFPKQETLDRRVTNEWYNRMEVLETRQEGIILNRNITPHQDEFLPKVVIMTESLFRFFPCRREESTSIDDDIVGFWVFWVLYILYRSPIRVLQNLPDSEFEVYEVFGTTEVDGWKAKGHGLEFN